MFFDLSCAVHTYDTQLYIYIYIYVYIYTHICIYTKCVYMYIHTRVYAYILSVCVKKRPVVKSTPAEDYGLSPSSQLSIDLVVGNI